MDFPKQINKFINRHHVLSLSVSDGTELWSATSFYVFDSKKKAFYIVGDKTSRHCKIALNNKKISGTIILETRIISKIQGLQFTGDMYLLEAEDLKLAKIAYLKRFPYAILSKSALWTINLTSAKMTDNHFCFGSKLFWHI